MFPIKRTKSAVIWLRFDHKYLGIILDFHKKVKAPAILKCGRCWENGNLLFGVM